MLTYDDAVKYFSYDDKRGGLIRAISRGCSPAGATVGCVGSGGYMETKINGEKHYIHRLVWFVCKGYFPENDVDHINRVRTDNRIGNLREVSRSCNLKNCGNWSTNKTGVRGVRWNHDRKKWEARICYNYNQRYLGMDESFAEMVLLRLSAEQCLGWGDCNTESTARRYAIKNNLINNRG